MKINKDLRHARVANSSIGFFFFVSYLSSLGTAGMLILSVVHVHLTWKASSISTIPPGSALWRWYAVVPDAAVCEVHLPNNLITTSIILMIMDFIWAESKSKLSSIEHHCSFKQPSQVFTNLCCLVFASLWLMASVWSARLDHQFNHPVQSLIMATLYLDQAPAQPTMWVIQVSFSDSNFTK